MNREFIPIKTRQEVVKLMFNDIMYVKKDLRRMEIITNNRSIYIYGQMEDLLPYLDERFLHCHRSYIFNMDKIIRIANQTIHLEAGTEIWLGKESFRRGKNKFFEYMERQVRESKKQNGI